MTSTSSRPRWRRLAAAGALVALGTAVAGYMGAFASTPGSATASAQDATAGGSTHAGSLGSGNSTASTAAPVPVSLAAAQSRDLPIWSEAFGSVTALNVVSVRARVDGQLDRVLFTEGQRVRKGELLAVVDPRPLQAAAQQAEAVLAQETAKLASLRVDLKRATELAAAGAGPTQTVDTLQAQVRTGEASTQAAQAALDSAKLQLSFTRITAPADGRIGQRLVPAGSMVHAADATGIATITQMDPVWVSFQVPQDVLAQVVDRGRTKPLRVDAMARDRSRTLGQGTLDFVDSQVTAATGQVVMKARFDNVDGGLWPGELVAVRMLLRTEAKATVVPDPAIQQGPSGAFVYVVDAQRRAQTRTVDAPTAWNGLRWIRSGLRPGETVVTQGQYRIAPGVPVTDAMAAPAVALGDRP